MAAKTKSLLSDVVEDDDVYIEVHLLQCSVETSPVIQYTGNNQVVETIFDDVVCIDVNIKSVDSVTHALTEYISKTKHVDKKCILFRHIFHLINNHNKSFLKGSVLYPTSGENDSCIHLQEKAQDAGDIIVRLGVLYTLYTSTKSPLKATIFTELDSHYKPKNNAIALYHNLDMTNLQTVTNGLKEVVSRKFSHYYADGLHLADIAAITIHHYLHDSCGNLAYPKRLSTNEDVHRIVLNYKCNGAILGIIWRRSETYHSASLRNICAIGTCKHNNRQSDKSKTVQTWQPAKSLFTNKRINAVAFKDMSTNSNRILRIAIPTALPEQTKQLEEQALDTWQGSQIISTPMVSENVNEQTGLSSGYSMDVKEQHESSNTYFMDVKEEPESSSNYFVDVKEVLESSNGFSSMYVKEELECSNGFSMDVKEELESSNGFSIDVKEEPESSSSYSTHIIEPDSIGIKEELESSTDYAIAIKEEAECNVSMHIKESNSDYVVVQELNDDMKSTPVHTKLLGYYGSVTKMRWTDAGICASSPVHASLSETIPDGVINVIPSGGTTANTTGVSPASTQYSSTTRGGTTANTTGVSPSSTQYSSTTRGGTTANITGVNPASTQYSSIPSGGTTANTTGVSPASTQYSSTTRGGTTANTTGVSPASTQYSSTTSGGTTTNTTGVSPASTQYSSITSGGTTANTTTPVKHKLPSHTRRAGSITMHQNRLSDSLRASLKLYFTENPNIKYYDLPDKFNSVSKTHFKYYKSKLATLDKDYYHKREYIIKYIQDNVFADYETLHLLYPDMSSGQYRYFKRKALSMPPQHVNEELDHSRGNSMEELDSSSGNYMEEPESSGGNYIHMKEPDSIKSDIKEDYTMTIREESGYNGDYSMHIKESESDSVVCQELNDDTCGSSDYGSMTKRRRSDAGIKPGSSLNASHSQTIQKGMINIIHDYTGNENCCVFTDPDNRRYETRLVKEENVPVTDEGIPVKEERVPVKEGVPVKEEVYQ